MSDLVYIGLGSNLGDREQNLLFATQALARIDAAALLRHSALFDSAAVGPRQPRFLNAVVEMECDLPPERLLTILKQIEADLGRVPSEKWGPRAIDLDILLWGSTIVASPLLQVPHLHLHKRRFALEPLCQLAPDARHPVLGVTIQELLQRAPAQDVSRHVGALWPEAQP
ncbi:MAG TPA: 2-amino-4-hydroxy-6-hydroxymethyldihydropteridine diphosphokinase [Myxococcales bacterium]|nr:2-amino-4-hydroxy-6-hydroxymethyldihydropteridine diphosphokinase [Myxococcales bacterium]